MGRARGSATSSTTASAAPSSQNGDDVLLLVDCFAVLLAPIGAAALAGVPAHGRCPADAPPCSSSTTSTSAAREPSAPAGGGATVRSAAATFTTAADGIAHVTFAGAGPVACGRRRPAHVPSATESTCVTNGVDGAVRQRRPPPDTTAPAAKIPGIRNGQRFRAAARRASCAARCPTTRRACGRSRSASPAGSTARAGTSPAAKEQFLKRTCGKQYAFKVGDRAEWSYLLPAPPAARPLRALHLRDRQRVQPRRGEPGGVPRPMRRLVVIALAAVAVAVPAPARPRASSVMVVGKERVLHAPTEVRLKVRKVRVAGRRCRIGAATPLSVLVATRLPLGLRDYGHCGRRPRDAAGLYVARVQARAREGPRRLGLQGRPAHAQHRRRRPQHGGCATASASRGSGASRTTAAAASARSRRGPTARPRRPARR